MSWVEDFTEFVSGLGYEIVGFDKPSEDEVWLGENNRIWSGVSPYPRIILRPIQPFRKMDEVLKTGWVTRYCHGGETWHELEPTCRAGVWSSGGMSVSIAELKKAVGDFWIPWPDYVCKIKCGG